MLNAWLHTFLSDTKVHIAFLLVLVDLALGILASFKLGTFNLSYVADFLRNDILFKLVPYCVVYIAALVAGHQDVVIPGLDFGVLAGTFYAFVVAAWVGSILTSVNQLRVPTPVPQEFAVVGPENNAPPKD